MELVILRGLSFHSHLLIGYCLNRPHGLFLAGHPRKIERQIISAIVTGNSLANMVSLSVSVSSMSQLTYAHQDMMPSLTACLITLYHGVQHASF